MSENRRLWVDDDRNAPLGWERAKTSAEAIQMLSAGIYDTISLDYSLAYMNMDTTQPVVEWMKENYFPKTIHIHTGSPSGRRWLVEQINEFGPGVANVCEASNV